MTLLLTPPCHDAEFILGSLFKLPSMELAFNRMSPFKQEYILLGIIISSLKPLSMWAGWGTKGGIFFARGDAAAGAGQTQQHLPVLWLYSNVLYAGESNLYIDTLSCIVLIQLNIFYNQKVLFYFCQRRH